MNSHLKLYTVVNQRYIYGKAHVVSRLSQPIIQLLTSIIGRQALITRLTVDERRISRSTWTAVCNIITAWQEVVWETNWIDYQGIISIWSTVTQRIWTWKSEGSVMAVKEWRKITKKLENVMSSMPNFSHLLEVALNQHNISLKLGYRY